MTYAQHIVSDAIIWPFNFGRYRVRRFLLGRIHKTTHART